MLAQNRQAGKYTVTADLVKIDQPLFGASMTVTASVKYTLVERDSGNSVYLSTLTTPLTAAWNSSFVGAERVRLANEGAIQANIKKLIDGLTMSRIPAR